MKKLMLNLVLLTALITPLFHSNQICADQKDKKEKWTARKKKGYQQARLAEENKGSLLDHVTLDNVGAATILLVVGLASGGGILAAVLPWWGVTTAPSIATGALSGALVGAGVGIGGGTAAYGLKGARAVKRYCEKEQ